jgi:iron(III) transport system permease protein
LLSSDTSAGALRARPNLLRAVERHLLLGIVIVYLVAFALWPLARLFVDALAPNDAGEALGTFRDQWSSRFAWRALRNTLEASLLATGFSVLLGTAAAVTLALTNVRAKGAAMVVLLLPLLIPSQITALAWIELTGPSSPILAPLGLAPEPGSTNPLYSKWGIVLVMGVEHAPLVFLAVRAALMWLPGDVVEAARLAGARPLRIVRSILLPLAVPSILSGAALAFVASIGNFGVPALLGIPGRYTMLTTLIYQRLQGFGPRVLGEVAALAVILTLLAGLGLILRALFSRHLGAPVERSSAPLDPFRLKGARVFTEAGLWLVLLAIAVLPLIALVGTSLLPALGVPLSAETITFSNYRFVLFGYEAAQRAFLNSFMLALGAAMISAAIALPLAYLSVLQRQPLARGLDLVADTPYAIPGTVLGIAIIIVFLPPLPILDVSLYNTGWIILVAYLGRFLALVLRPTVAAMESLDPAMDEAARAAGASLFARLRMVILPLAAPTLAAGALLIFMQAFNELTVSALLWSSGWETLGVVVFFLHREGNTTAASALATLALIAALALAAVAALVARRLPSGIMPWRG